MDLRRTCCRLLKCCAARDTVLYPLTDRQLLAVLCFKLGRKYDPQHLRHAETSRPYFVEPSGKRYDLFSMNVEL